MKIYDVKVEKGTEVHIDMDIAHLPSRTPINIPVIINRAEEDGPVLLIMAGMHGDEINGVEIVRRIIENDYHKPDRGTIIAIPLVNVFGFINFSREVPDGKDVNRSFPGTSKGSLASQVAYALMKHIVPHIDYGIDFHTGGASRSNYPQIRTFLEDEKNALLAAAFNAPFTIHSDMIPKSFRHAAFEKEKPILVYEGGEALRYDEHAIQIGVECYRNFIGKMEMSPVFERNERGSLLIHKMKWVRAQSAGLFNSVKSNGSLVQEGDVLGSISGPFGDYKEEIVSPYEGYIVGLNNNPVVNRGDALIHIGMQE